MKMHTETIIELEARIPADFSIGYWYDDPQTMPESEQRHVIEMMESGYVEGELNDGNVNRGWWRILRTSW